MCFSKRVRTGIKHRCCNTSHHITVFQIICSDVIAGLVHHLDVSQCVMLKTFDIAQNLKSLPEHFNACISLSLHFADNKLQKVYVPIFKQTIGNNLVSQRQMPKE